MDIFSDLPEPKKEITISKKIKLDDNLIHKIAFAEAQKETDDDICKVYNIKLEQLIQLRSNNLYIGIINQFKKELDNGVGFKIKAKVYAEEMLDNAYYIANDLESPPSVRMDAIKSIAKWAGHDKNTDDKETSSVTINIDLGPTQKINVIKDI